VIEVHRAATRYRTDQPGIITWHSFSSGAHYDADNVSYGPVVACDEHLLDPGAGFERHRHARVELVTWVLDGMLRHEDASGRVRVVAPGWAQYQLAGAGIEHSERNASDSAPLHFVQLWLLADEDIPDYDLAPPPLALRSGRFAVAHACRDDEIRAAAVHAFVAAGRFTVAGHDLGPGDSVRADEPLTVTGDGELLLVELT
jgi:quercetin 2,3-dioxygenase